MSDEDKPEDGEGSPPADAEEGTGTAAESAPPPATTDKKKSRRKSVWVCVPTEWDEVAVNDGDGSMHAEKQPTRYAITECPGGEGQKKAILRVLAMHQIDPENYDGVMMFRADPIGFEISQQMIIRIN